MKKTYSQIIEEIESLQKKAEALKAREVEGVIARIKEAIEFYGLSAADLGLGGRGGAAKKAAASKRKGAPTGAKRGRKPGRKPGRPAGKASKKSARPIAFADAQGNTWSGRGPRPGWLKLALSSGANIEDFRQGGAKDSAAQA